MIRQWTGLCGAPILAWAPLAALDASELPPTVAPHANRKFCQTVKHDYLPPPRATATGTPRLLEQAFRRRLHAMGCQPRTTGIRKFRRPPSCAADYVSSRLRLRPGSGPFGRPWLAGHRARFFAGRHRSILHRGAGCSGRPGLRRFFAFVPHRPYALIHERAFTVRAAEATACGLGPAYRRTTAGQRAAGRLFLLRRGSQRSVLRHPAGRKRSAADTQFPAHRRCGGH